MLRRIFRRKELKENGKNCIMRSDVVLFTEEMEEMRNAYISAGNPEGTRPTGRHKIGCEDNISTDVQETVCECANWIHLAEDRVP
jgi:hypothetical protein